MKDISELLIERLEYEKEDDDGDDKEDEEKAVEDGMENGEEEEGGEEDDDSIETPVGVVGGGVAVSGAERVKEGNIIDGNSSVDIITKQDSRESEIEEKEKVSALSLIRSNISKEGPLNKDIPVPLGDILSQTRKLPALILAGTSVGTYCNLLCQCQ